MSSNALITGSSGLLGLNLLLHEPQPYQFYAHINKRRVNLANIQTITIDLGNLKSIEEALKIYSPKVVIHAAGITNVDGCDEDPETANFINGKVPSNIAKVCKDHGVKLVHISTDHLFDGTNPFTDEEAPVKPLNAYGYSKALGEEGVLKNNDEAIIIRCNFFTWGPSYRQSFSDFIYDNLSKGKAISLADDFFYTPALAQNLIEAILSLLGKDAKGIFNVVGSERLSKYKFGMNMAKIFGYNDDLINKVNWASLGAKAIRPADMSLSDQKIRKFLGYDLGTSNRNIQGLKTLMNTNLYNKVRSL